MRQYQVLQEDDGAVVVRVIPRPGCDRAGLLRRLETGYRDVFEGLNAAQDRIRTPDRARRRRQDPRSQVAGQDESEPRTACEAARLLSKKSCRQGPILI